MSNLNPFSRDRLRNGPVTLDSGQQEGKEVSGKVLCSWQSNRKLVFSSSLYVKKGDSTPKCCCQPFCEHKENQLMSEDKSSKQNKEMERTCPFDDIFLSHWTNQHKTHSLVTQMVKNLPAMQTWVQSLGWEDSLEEGMESHSSILAWRIPTDRGAWQATVHEVAKNQTRLSN